MMAELSPNSPQSSIQAIKIHHNIFEGFRKPSLQKNTCPHLDGDPGGGPGHMCVCVACVLFRTE